MSSMVRRTNRWRLARLVTEIFAPSPVAVVAIALIAIRYSGALTNAIKWAGLTILFVAVVPFAFVVGQVLLGRVTDIHVRQREQRGPVILLSFLTWLLAIGVLYRFGAPRELVAVIVTGVVALVVIAIITYWWKISLHVSVITGVLTVFLLTFGRPIFPLLLLIPLVAWARVELRDHTLRQTIAGAVIGAIVSGYAYPVIAARLH